MDNLTTEALATIRKLDADLAAMRQQNERMMRDLANAMLSNAAPKPAMVALDDAPRQEYRGRPMPTKRVNVKRWRHANNADYYAASGFLSPAKRIS